MEFATSTEATRRAPPSPAGQVALELSSVWRAFGGFQALRGVSLRVHAGERVAILGPSGAGKSTLLRLANTSLAPTSGAVRVLGEDPARLPGRRLRALRARIGTIYQQLQLVPQASALENVLMGRLGTRSALEVALAPLRAREREEVARLLARVGMGERLLQRVDRLSGGEQQRVAVARILHQAPDLLVADEPFASVDPTRSAEIVSLLLEAARGRALLLSTHQLEPALAHFPRLVGLREGMVLFDKRREEVTDHDLARLYQAEGATSSHEAPAPVDPPAGPARGVLLVGASTTPGEYLLPGLLGPFACGHPHVRLRLAVKDTDEILQDLLGGTVELAFVGARRVHPLLRFEDFAEDEIVLLASPGFPGLPPGPLSAAAAAALPRVDREAGSSTRALVEAQFAAMGVALDPEAAVLEAGSIESLKGAVAAGLGVGFASRRAVAPEVASGRLRIVPIDHIRIPRRLFVAWRRAEPLSPPARALLAALRSAQGDG